MYIKERCLTNIKSIEYREARSISHGDPALIGPDYVRRNLADLSLGLLPEFPDFLSLSSFSMSFISFNYYIYEFENDKNNQSIWSKVYTMTMPFDNSLCYALIFFICRTKQICN